MKIQEILKLDLPLFKKAYEIASVVHKDQRRNDGKTPYMAHIDAVVENTYKLITKEAYVNLYMDIFLAIAALHDAVEDHPDEISYYDIEIQLTPIAYEKYDKLKSGAYAIDQIVTGVKAITKLPKGTEPYIAYVLRLKDHAYAGLVKRADLMHNMSDLKPGNMLDKYSVTKYILEN